MYANVIAATRIHPDATNGLITLEIEHPEYVHAQTIRTSWLSPNYVSHRTSAFSNGVKFYVPDKFHAKGKGMTPGAESPADMQEYALETWLEACNMSWVYAKRMDDAGFAFEESFRLIAPPHLMRGVLTATEHSWRHFIALRTHKGADNAMQLWAYMVKEAIDDVEWQIGDEHIPYWSPELDQMVPLEKVKISAARCARVSFGEPGANPKDLKLAESMIARNEPSPFEQSAIADLEQWCGPSRLNSKPQDRWQGMAWHSGRNTISWEDRA